MLPPNVQEDRTTDQPSAEEPEESKKFDFRSYTRQFINPAYHFRKIQEDVRLALKAIRSKKLRDHFTSVEDLADAIRGRLFATFALSSMFASVGFAVGLVAQYSTGSIWVGLFTTLLVGNIMGILSYQTIWTITNWDLYRNRASTFWGRIWQMELDLLPLQLRGFRIVIIINAMTIPINMVLIWALNLIIPNQVNYIPAGVLAPMIEFLLFNAPMIRLIGDLFERYSRELALKYSKIYGPFPVVQPA